MSLQSREEDVKQEGGFLRLDEIEQKVCDIASEQLGISRAKISPADRIIEDLHCDSLDLVELFIEVEEAFEITLPERDQNPVYKAVFTRHSFRLSDLAELAYLQQGTGRTDQGSWRRARTELPTSSSIPFTQLGGRLVGQLDDRSDLFEPLEPADATRQYRRKSDGMRCILVPTASVEIGNDEDSAHQDERPRHVVLIDSFLIDAEPVSTTAYCRFLNSLGEVSPEILKDWFVLDRNDDRNVHMLIHSGDSGWTPVEGAERLPMILVSWYGASAYSLWVNGGDCLNYRGKGGEDTPSYLPTEAQWEYAARGSHYRNFPWGGKPPSDALMRYNQHRKGATYRPDTLPMAEVNVDLGMSPFGLHHMAGNVWQWCRDWYDETFYSKPGAIAANPVNQASTKVRSERGGSWIGPADLCRSSFRRGRPPAARGRCLGFRCVSKLVDSSHLFTGLLGIWGLSVW